MRSIEEKEEQGQQPDTEITLGMKSLLGVFFGLVLICGVFFGFGYSLGRGSSSSPKPASHSTSESAAKTNPSQLASEQDLTSPAGQTASNSPTLSEPGGPARSPENPEEVETNPPRTTPKPSAASVIKPVTQEPAGPALSAPPKPTPAIASPSSAEPQSAKASPPVTSSSTTPRFASSAQTAATTTRTPPAEPTMVQIAAVSNQEDANVLVSALRKRGYNVVVRNEPTDSLLHIQIGPFASRDEAKAMRAKLLADGYNAILK